MARKAFSGEPKHSSLSQTLKRFLKKHKDKIYPIIMFSLIGFPVLFGGGFLLLSYAQDIGYFVSRENAVVEVVEKETNDLRRRRCTIAGPYGGCAAYETYTQTQYIVITPFEKFHTQPELYDQIEAGGEYKVRIVGWESLPPRQIISLIN